MMRRWSELIVVLRHVPVHPSYDCCCDWLMTVLVPGGDWLSWLTNHVQPQSEFVSGFVECVDIVGMRFVTNQIFFVYVVLTLKIL